MMHLMPFTCRVFITVAAIFYVLLLFFHSRPVMVAIVRPLRPEPLTSGTLYARPARAEVGGATVKQ